MAHRSSAEAQALKLAGMACSLPQLPAVFATAQQHQECGTRLPLGSALARKQAAVVKQAAARMATPAVACSKGRPAVRVTVPQLTPNCMQASKLVDLVCMLCMLPCVCRSHLGCLACCSWHRLLDSHALHPETSCAGCTCIIPCRLCTPACPVPCLQGASRSENIHWHE
jgi:hypothetical protein